MRAICIAHDSIVIADLPETHLPVVVPGIVDGKGRAGSGYPDCADALALGYDEIQKFTGPHQDRDIRNNNLSLLGDFIKFEAHHGESSRGGRRWSGLRLGLRGFGLRGLHFGGTDEGMAGCLEQTGQCVLKNRVVDDGYPEESTLTLYQLWGWGTPGGQHESLEGQEPGQVEGDGGGVTQSGVAYWCSYRDGQPIKRGVQGIDGSGRNEEHSISAERMLSGFSIDAAQMWNGCTTDAVSMLHECECVCTGLLSNKTSYTPPSLRSPFPSLPIAYLPMVSTFTILKWHSELANISPRSRWRTVVSASIKALDFASA
ncbi:hypothetical protein DFH07DRAFT_767525 [Mycena maculata]|uniref:Uncharacterized protein n=1 Tax=Mycena maculata TaxID=230809 RepID=A0AAD7K155_9AGAR|nr:hypothetical protein DFH07DRAFT_767525 [Mycena maculata]